MWFFRAAKGNYWEAQESVETKRNVVKDRIRMPTKDKNKLKLEEGRIPRTKGTWI